METAITLKLILAILGTLVAIVAGIGAILALIGYITSVHDKRKKYDAYEKQIGELHTEMDAKLQEIKAEQCMLTYCMYAVLEGLGQLKCNGPVTEARNELNKFMNKQAHDVK